MLKERNEINNRRFCIMYLVKHYSDTKVSEQSSTGTSEGFPVSVSMRARPLCALYPTDKSPN